MPKPMKKPKPIETKAAEEAHPIDSTTKTLQLLVKNFYDLQLLRMQSAGRHNKTTGPQTQLDERDLERLKIHTERLSLIEQGAQKEIEQFLKEIPFYMKVLRDKDRFKGLGPVLSAVILSSFDIHRADTISKMWAFAGLRPLPCRRCKECQNVVIENDAGLYTHERRVKKAIDSEEGGTAAPKCSRASMQESDTFPSGKAQRPTKGEKLPYNAFLRAKLIGVLGSGLLRNASPWRKFYDDYKHRKQSAGWGVSDGHRHKAATRYMVKIMLLEIWKAWREFEGLPVRPSYQEEKLGHVH